MKQRAWSYEIDGVIKRERLLYESENYKVFLGKEPGGDHLVIKETPFTNHRELYNEFKLLFNLNHPGIIKALDFYFYPDYKSVLLLEYLKGGNLKERIDRGESIDLLSFSKNLFDILAYLGKNNVVHADIKPENILFPDENSQLPVLSDFGLASGNKKERARGTVLYSAPEVIEGKKNTHKSDVFSAGVLLYETFTGDRINDFNKYRELFLEEKWKKKVKNGLLRKILEKALIKDPKRRPTASQILEEIFKEKRFYLNEFEFINKENEKLKKELVNIMKRKGEGVYIIEGEKGSGKTFLLRKFMSEIRAEINTILIEGGRIPYLTIPEDNLYPFVINHLLNLRSDTKFAVIIIDPPYGKESFRRFLKGLEDTVKYKNLALFIEDKNEIIKGKRIKLNKIEEEKILTYLEENTGLLMKQDLIKKFIRRNESNLKNIFNVIKTVKKIEELEIELKKKPEIKRNEKEIISTINFFGKLNSYETEIIFGSESIEKLLKKNIIERIHDYFISLYETDTKLPYKKIYEKLKKVQELSKEGKLLLTISALQFNDYNFLKDVEEEIKIIGEENENYLIKFFNNFHEKIRLSKIPPKILRSYFNYLLSFKKESRKLNRILRFLKQKDKEEYQLLYSLYLYTKGEFEKAYKVVKDIKSEEALLWRGQILINIGDIEELRKVIRTYRFKYYLKTRPINLALFHRIEAYYHELKGDIAKADIAYKKSLFNAKKHGETWKSYMFLIYYMEFLYIIGRKDRAFRYVNKLNEFYKIARIFPRILLLLEFLRFEFYKDGKDLNFLENIKKRIDIVFESINLPYVEPYVISIYAKLNMLKHEDPSLYFEKAIELSKKYKLYSKLIDLTDEYLKYLRIKNENRKFVDILKTYESYVDNIYPYHYRIMSLENTQLYFSVINNFSRVEEIARKLVDNYRKIENYEREKLELLLLYLLNIEKDERIKKEILKKLNNIVYPSEYVNSFKHLIKAIDNLIINKFVDSLTEFDRFSRSSSNFVKNVGFLKDFIIFTRVILNLKDKTKLTESGILPKIDNFITKISEKLTDEFIRNELNNIKNEIIKMSSFGGIRKKEKWDIFRSYLIYASKYNNEKEFLNKTIEILVKATDTERGMIVLRKDDEKEIFEIKALYGAYRKKVGKDLIDISMSSLKDATKKGAHFYVADAFLDPDLKKRESIRKFRIRSILCVPLYYNDKPFGAIYLDSKRKKEFTDEDFELVRIMADVFTISYQRNRLIGRIEEEKEKIEKEKREVEKKLKEIERIGEIVGTRDFIARITGLIDRIKNLEKPIPILIVGETGTGKTLLADTIHRASIRKKGPIVFFSFNDFPETLVESELFGYKKGAFTGAFEDKIGLIEQADNGTLVLENIESIPPSLQDKLLRFLDTGKIRPLGSTKEKEIDVMIIATALPEIEEKVKKREIRQDLYYRLKGIYFYLPPLRERTDDIPVLITHFIEDIKKRHGITEKIRIKHETWDYLYKYPWPGNVRELKFAFEAAVLNAKPGELIGPEHFPKEIREVKEEKRFLSLKEMEKKYIMEVLNFTKWNKSEAAKILKISRQALLQKLKDFEIF